MTARTFKDAAHATNRYTRPWLSSGPAWRHPDVPADGILQVEHYVRSTQIAERGKLDMIFFADGAGIRQGDNPRGSLSRTGRDMVELEPMTRTLLPALAMNYCFA